MHAKISQMLAKIADANTDESDAISKYFDLLSCLSITYDSKPCAEIEELYHKIAAEIIPEEQKHMRILSDAIEVISGIEPEEE